MTNTDKYQYLNGRQLHSIKKAEYTKNLYNYYGFFSSTHHRKDSGFEFKDETDYLVVIYFGEQEEYFDQYFKANYLFRFHRLKLIKTIPKKPHTLFPATVCEIFNRDSIVVFNLYTNNPGVQRFHFSSKPTITESDLEFMKKKEFEFSKKISDISIFDLRPIENTFLNLSLCVQVIGFEILKERTAVLKVWDGTCPQFEVVDPKTWNEIHEDKHVLKKDRTLDIQSRKKEIYILVLGYEHLTFIHRLETGDFILLHNFVVYHHKKKCKIILEINDIKKGLNKQLLKVDKESYLGQNLLKKLINSMNEDYSIQNTSNQFTNISFDSYIESQEPQNVIFVKDIKDMKDSNKTYKLSLKILNMFPLDYDYGDLIYLNCTKCTLNESIKSLFLVDFKNFIKSLDKLNFGRKDLTFAYMTCPQCLTTGLSKLRFFIIFVLKDLSGKKLIATLKDDDAEEFFGYEPLEIIFNKEKKFMFDEKLKFLINRESCSFKIFKEISNLYFIKNVFFF